MLYWSDHYSFTSFQTEGQKGRRKVKRRKSGKAAKGVGKASLCADRGRKKIVPRKSKDEGGSAPPQAYQERETGRAGESLKVKKKKPFLHQNQK